MLPVHKIQIVIASAWLIGLLFLAAAFQSLCSLTAGGTDVQPVTIACTSGSGSGNSCGS